MAQKTRTSVAVLALVTSLGIVQVVHEGTAAAQAQKQGAGVPRFQVDPNWPKPLPNNWTFGEFSGVAVDSRDHVWIDQRPRTLGGNDTENLSRPAKMQVFQKTNELFVADGYGNRRVKDDLVYVADRVNNRIQVFKPDGTFVKEGFIARTTAAMGSAYDVELSPDQQFLYVPDGSNNHVCLNRNTLRVLGNFGRQGRYAGQFHHVHSIAVDSEGNIFVAETQGKRVQKFLFKGVSS